VQGGSKDLTDKGCACWLCLDCGWRSWTALAVGLEAGVVCERCGSMLLTCYRGEDGTSRQALQTSASFSGHEKRG